MFDGLLKLISKATSVEPAYDRELCLAARQSTAACSACRDACPHEAITISDAVVIDEVDCTGCGLCVRICPTQALSTRPTYERGRPVKCTRVRGSAQTVTCLGRLAPTDLLRLVGDKDGVELARGDCAGCPIGGAALPPEIERTRAAAEELARAHGRPVEITVRVTDRLDADQAGDPVSRRELLRGGLRGLQRGAADMLAPLDPGTPGDASLPVEMQRQYRVLEAGSPGPDDLVPWRLPRVADGCIMCPACTRACPTDAFSRDFHPDGREGAVLRLEPDRCMGCAACVDACPVSVITMDDSVTWGELSGGSQEAYYKDPRQGRPGSVAR